MNILIVVICRTILCPALWGHWRRGGSCLLRRSGGRSIRRGSGFSSPGTPNGRTISIPGGAELRLYPLHPGDRGLEIVEQLRPASAGQAIWTSPPSAARSWGVCWRRRMKSELIEKVTLIGLCTDICVISNACWKALPPAEVAVDAACCAGVTPSESHRPRLRP